MNQDLINRAQELRNHGFTTGEIADDQWILHNG